MPNTTDPYWVARVHELAERRPKLGAVKIETELGEIAAREDRTGYPGLTTIKRLLALHRRLSESERAPYREFHWPHAMVSGALPWEASRLALDVLREEWVRHKTRPSIERVLWHWRVSLAIPGADYEGREPEVNRYLVVNLPSPSLEWGLAFNVWYGHDEGNQEIHAAFPDGYPDEGGE